MFYDRVLFPFLCDILLRQPRIMHERRTLLADAAGRILEIGFGTGLNLSCYPEHVRDITALDPNPGMQRLAQKRIRRALRGGVRVDQRIAGSERLPFADATFDCAVSTFTLCSVDAVEQALGEIHRVLKPGGRLLLLEHGLSRRAAVERWQRRLNPLEKRLGGGCRLDRDFAALLARSPFARVQLTEIDLPGAPPTHGHLYRGAAVK